MISLSFAAAVSGRTWLPCQKIQIPNFLHQSSIPRGAIPLHSCNSPSGRGCEMTTSQRYSILKQPQTVKQMQFLGLINFSRHFIRDYAIRTASLRGIMKMAGLSNSRVPLNKPFLTLSTLNLYWPMRPLSPNHTTQPPSE